MAAIRIGSPEPACSYRVGEGRQGVLVERDTNGAGSRSGPDQRVLQLLREEAEFARRQRQRDADIDVGGAPAPENRGPVRIAPSHTATPQLVVLVLAATLVLMGFIYAYDDLVRDRFPAFETQVNTYVATVDTLKRSLGLAP